MENHTTELRPIGTTSHSLRPETEGEPSNNSSNHPSSKPKAMKVCPSCSRIQIPEAMEKCWDCMARDNEIAWARKEADEMVADLENVVAKDLKQIGLSNREIRADWSRVSRRYKDAIQQETLRALSEGRVPSKGFGIGSDTGTGKTMAVAAIVKGFQKASRRLFASRLVETAKKGIGATLTQKSAIVWLSWPDAVTILRAHAVDGIAEDVLSRAESSPLLVLDDLGRERIKGSYVDDWAASQLDRIVNHRYREEMPIIWTTNLKESALVAIYGAAMVSRLTEDNPLVWLQDMPSMRIQ